MSETSTSLVASGYMQTIQYYENAQYFLNEEGPFNVDLSSGGQPQLNFGYGYDLTAQGASGITALQNDGLPQSVINYLQNNGTAGATAQTASDLNSLLDGQSEQGAASAVMQSTFQYNEGKLNTIMGGDGIDYSTLPTGIQMALADVAYNSGLYSAAFGPSLVSDMQLGDYGAAAFELAYDTATPVQTGYENRVLLEAAMMLGFVPSVDSNGNTVLDGSPDLTDVTQFIDATTSVDGVGSSFLGSQNGFSLLNEAFQYEIDSYSQQDESLGEPANSADIEDNNGESTVYISDPSGYDQISQYSPDGSLISQTIINDDGSRSEYTLDTSTGTVIDETTVNSGGTTTQLSIGFGDDPSSSGTGTYSSSDASGDQTFSTPVYAGYSGTADASSASPGSSPSEDNSPPEGSPPVGSGDVGNAAADMDGGDDQASPLVLDLSGSGLNLTALNYLSPYFDLTGDGFATKTGWIGAGTGLLCIDTGDGQINSGLELFGTASGFPNGFADLQQLDSNGDGVIDSSDADFSELRVWVDANANGVVDPGELFTLAQLGIVSINLNATAVNETIAGNSIRYVSTFTLADGAQHTIADAWFTTSPTYTRPDDAVAISSSIASLPEVNGFGSMPDLQSAMVSDPALAAMVENFQSLPSSTDPSLIASDVQAIMFEWAGATNVDPNGTGSIDGRELDFLEKYTGIQSTYDGYSVTGIGPERGAYFNQAWNDVFDGIQARLLLQSGVSAEVPEFTFNAASDFVLPVVDLATSFKDAFARLGEISQANFAQWVLVLRTADAFRLDAHWSMASYLQTIESASSAVIASVANAISSDIEVSAGPGNTIIETGAQLGSTFYVGADTQSSGPIEIFETNYSADPDSVLELGPGVTSDDMKVSNDGSGDLYLTDSASGVQIELEGEFFASYRGVQTIQFADGSSWTKAQLQTLASQVVGTSGADILYGTAAADVIDGEGAPAGSQDYEQGGGGGDTFIYNPGYGALEISEEDYSATADNVLQFGPGITAAQVQVTSNAADGLVLTDGVSGDQITIDAELGNPYCGVQAVDFADGSSWTKAQLLALATAGSNGANVFVLAPGRDTFTFGDSSRGGPGTNTVLFDKGDGQATVVTGDGTGTLQLGADIAASDVLLQADRAGDLIVALRDDPADSVTFQGDLTNHGWGVSSQLGQIVFGDGTTLAIGQPSYGQGVPFGFTWVGTAANTTLVGSDYGSNTFDLGAGGDTVTFGDSSRGGPGTNTVLFDKGDGQATVVTGDGTGALQLGADINEADVLVTEDRSGDLVLTLQDTGDSLTVLGALASGSDAIQGITFADGTMWTRSQLAFLASTGTSGPDTITGTSGNDVFDGRGGSDTITGGGGYDTYLYRQGYGALTIDNSTAGGTQPEGEIDFGPGITEQNLWFNQVGNDLIASVLGSADTVDIKGWFGANLSAQLAELKAFDGLELDSQVGQLVSIMAGYQAANPAFNPMTAAAMPSDPSLRSALAAAWHS